MTNPSLPRICRVIFAYAFSLILLSAHSFAGDDELKVKPYGFIKAEVSSSSRALDSYGNTNLSAPVTVTPPSSLNSARAASSFQVAQTRFGASLTKRSTIGHLEFDLIDFTKSSPTTQALPRLRIATIEYQLNPDEKFVLGQDWDLFAPMERPISYNFVGVYFHAGNVGFMRNQFRYHLKLNDWELASAVGLVKANATAGQNEVEMTGLPTLSLRAVKTLSEQASFGIAALVTKIRPSLFPTPLAGVYGVNTFFTYLSPSGFKLTEGLYWGQNLGSIGTLALANSSLDGSRHEAGGFLTAYQPLSETFSIQGGFGAAGILESKGSTFDGVVGSNIMTNWKVEMALTYSPEKPMNFFIQPSYFQSAYRQGQKVSVIGAVQLEVGGLYRF